MDKVFKCLTCGADIRLERDQQNNKWIKYNLDNSPHIDERKQQKGSSQQTQQKIEQLTTEITELRSEVKNLVAAVQFMRMEFAKQSKK